MVSNCCYFISVLAWTMWSLDTQGLATKSCQVYPSQYAYSDDFVTKAEIERAKCTRYPTSTPLVVSPESYIHCKGSKLKLIDSDLGSEQYNDSDYYVWNAGTSGGQLLFIFPRRVNLTGITLHYYSDSVRSLPRLRFFEVPDDFNVWNAPTISNRHVEVTAKGPDGIQAGQRKISISLNFHTDSILTIKVGSNTYSFAVSEVEFFTCTDQMTTTRIASTTNTEAITSMMILPNISHPTISTKTTFQIPESISSTKSFITTQSSKIPHQPGDNVTVFLTVGLVIILLLAASLILVVILLLLWHNQRTHSVRIESKFEEDLSYSTLDRGTKQQTQAQSPNAPTELYDQIQLSPFTGQSEPIHKNESDNVITCLSSDCHQMQESTVTETSSDLLETEKSNLENHTYAVVDKKKKKSEVKIKEQKQEQDKKPQKGILPEHLTAADQEDSGTAGKSKDQPSHRKENLEEMYAVVHKKLKKCEEQEDVPCVPSYTIESLYTAVQKKPK